MNAIRKKDNRELGQLETMLEQMAERFGKMDAQLSAAEDGKRSHFQWDGHRDQSAGRRHLPT